MDEDEHILLTKIKDHYWIGLSKLVAACLNKAPEHLHGELLMMLQDSSSVYGSSYEDYLKEKK